tara:strand:- start:1109 stop:1222 length:114 start_codon:yes stop_codon:yes gene_type:complete
MVMYNMNKGDATTVEGIEESATQDFFYSGAAAFHVPF